MKNVSRPLFYILATVLISFLIVLRANGQNITAQNQWSELTKNIINAVVIVIADLPASDTDSTSVTPPKFQPRLFHKISSERVKAKERIELIKPVLLAEEEVKSVPEEWQTAQRQNIALGTGTIIHPNGFVLTNNHVVDGATNIRIILRDGRGFGTEVAGREPRYDAALLKIKTPKPLNLPYLKAAPLNTIEAGQMFVAAGHPLGLLFNTQLGAIAHPPPEDSLKPGGMESSIILRGAGIFPPGSSGTPLVNSDKRVMGMLFAAVEKIYFPGFAVAVEPIVKHFLKERRLPPIPE